MLWQHSSYEVQNLGYINIKSTYQVFIGTISREYLIHKTRNLFYFFSVPGLIQARHVTSKDRDRQRVTTIPSMSTLKTSNKITTTKSQSIFAEIKYQKVDTFLEIFWTNRPGLHPVLREIPTEQKVGSGSSKKIDKLSSKKLERRLSIFFWKMLARIRGNCTALLRKNPRQQQQ